MQQAIDTFGGPDVLVSDAGILRDRMLFSMEEAGGSAVIRVHRKGAFVPSRHAGSWCRERPRAGEANDARLITTTSVSGLSANVGQANAGSAEAGIVAFTQIAAQELARDGVGGNAIAPGPPIRLTGDLAASEEVRCSCAPEAVAPAVTSLASPESADVTGQIIEASGLVLAVAEAPPRTLFDEVS